MYQRLQRQIAAGVWALILTDNKCYRLETGKIYDMGNCCGSEDPESQVDVVSNNFETWGKALRMLYKPMLENSSLNRKSAPLNILLSFPLVKVKWKLSKSLSIFTCSFAFIEVCNPRSSSWWNLTLSDFILFRKCIIQ